jgi:hypothetical protein
VEKKIKAFGYNGHDSKFSPKNRKPIYKMILRVSGGMRLLFLPNVGSSF